MKAIPCSIPVLLIGRSIHLYISYARGGKPTDQGEASQAVELHHSLRRKHRPIHCRRHVGDQDRAGKSRRRHEVRVVGPQALHPTDPDLLASGGALRK